MDAKQTKCSRCEDTSPCAALHGWVRGSRGWICRRCAASTGQQFMVALKVEPGRDGHWEASALVRCAAEPKVTGSSCYGHRSRRAAIRGALQSAALMAEEAMVRMELAR